MMPRPVRRLRAVARWELGLDRRAVRFARTYQSLLRAQGVSARRLRALLGVPLRRALRLRYTNAAWTIGEALEVGPALGRDAHELLSEAMT